MSVYKDPRSACWEYDFQWRGGRFRGSTGARSRREAEAYERDEKERVKRQAEETESVGGSLKLDDVAERYWLDVGQHHAGEGASNTKRQLARLIEFFRR